MYIVFSVDRYNILKRMMAAAWYSVAGLFCSIGNICDC